MPPTATGGFPNSEAAAQGGDYYFSHVRNSVDGIPLGSNSPHRPGSNPPCWCETPRAINDQIGFADEVKTTTF